MYLPKGEVLATNTLTRRLWTTKFMRRWGACATAAGVARVLRSFGSTRTAASASTQSEPHHLELGHYRTASHSASSAYDGVLEKHAHGNSCRTWPLPWRAARFCVSTRHHQRLERRRLGVRRPRPCGYPLLPFEADHDEKCIAARQGLRIHIPGQRAIANRSDRVGGQNLCDDCSLYRSCRWC